MASTLLYMMLYMVGFTAKESSTMMCVAYHESKLDPKAVFTNPNGSEDLGIYQINSKWWIDSYHGCGFTRAELLEPLNNVKCAKKVYDRQGYTAWVAYNKHKKACDNYKLPASLLPISVLLISNPFRHNFGKIVP